MTTENTYTAFAGDEQIAAGDVHALLAGAKAHLDAGGDALLIFEDQTGIQVDFDFRGTLDDVLARLARHPHFAPAPTPPVPERTGPGRPSLGVVSREVTLLPRHWEWLEAQKGGISATLRRLVDEARKQGAGGERAAKAWDAAGKFMWTMAGNRPGFEEASRALYAKDLQRLEGLAKDWPDDVRTHLLRLAAVAAGLEAQA